MVKLTTIALAGTSSNAACTQLQQCKVALVFVGCLSATALQHSAEHLTNPVLKGWRIYSFLKEFLIPDLEK